VVICSRLRGRERLTLILHVDVDAAVYRGLSLVDSIPKADGLLAHGLARIRVQVTYRRAELAPDDRLV
jgi:hypothetical protein